MRGLSLLLGYLFAFAALVGSSAIGQSTLPSLTDAPSKPICGVAPYTLGDCEPKNYSLLKSEPEREKKRKTTSEEIVFYPIESREYIVKKGDTTSQIARTHCYGDLYGAGGCLDTLLSYNPQVKNKHLIHVREILYLGPLQKENPLSNPRELAQVQSVDRSPAQVEPEHDEPPWEKPSPNLEIALSPLIQYTRLTGVDANNSSTATLLSTLSSGFGIDVYQRIAPVLRLNLNFGYQSLQYQQPATANRALSQPTTSLTSFGGGPEFEFFKWLSVTLGVEFQQDFYFRGISTSVVTLDSTATIQPFLAAHLTYLTLGKTEIDSKFRLGVIIGENTDSYVINSGFNEYATIGITRNVSRAWYLSSDFDVNAIQASTTIENQNYLSVGLILSLGWRL